VNKLRSNLDPGARAGGLVRRAVERPFPRVLYLFAPIAIAGGLAGISDVVVFIASALAMVPAAKLMSDATEHLAAHSGAAVAGLVNVSLGNAPELIISVFALAAGLQEVVKAALVGSIIGNALLVLGGAMLVGGRTRQRQNFSATAAQTQTGLLLVTVTALILPAADQLIHGRSLPNATATRVSFSPTIQHLSLVVSATLIATYLTGLLFSLRTHRNLFADAFPEPREVIGWSHRRSVVAMVAGAGLVAILSHFLVHTVVNASHSLGLSQFFVGAFIVGIVGNAAEHYASLAAAARDDMNLAVTMAIGSASQIGLVVVPFLVILSFAVGPAPMSLVFNGWEIVALVFGSLITAMLTSDGESTWLEGIELLAVYALLGVLFYFG
jgi:Ca2+:H+ antiporter